MSLLLIVLLLQSGVNDRSLEGMVLDAQGLPVTGARITISERQGSTRRNAISAAEPFRVQTLTPAVYDVLVEADGFATQTTTADLRNQTTAVLEVRLEPARLAQEVIVAATRTEQRLGDLPASATVIRREQIKESAAVVVDDVLRQLPTFSLFRRSSSLAAHPTTQGVSLRGIGPSGVSRTLVLLDNIPANDPFGGWVYWTRVPLMNVDRIEMVDGANSSVYGNYALGGVINVVTNPPRRRTLTLKPQYGGRKNPRLDASGGNVWDGVGSLDFFASDVWNNFGAAVEGSVFNTNGYPIVIESARGLVDTKATVNYQNLNLKLDYTPSSEFSSFFRGGYFSENRSNAKICRPTSCEEANDTLWKFVSGGVRYVTPDQSDFQFRMFANFETFHSSFLGVPAATPLRSIARVSYLQKVPTKDLGGMMQWSKALGGRNYLTVGADWHWVKGDSLEDVMDGATGTRVVLNRLAGGMQRSIGVFIQDLITVTPKLNLTLSARLDRWRNYNARNLETAIPSGLPTANSRPSLPDKESTVGSPHVGALYRVNDSVSLWGGLSWGFRAPTLNELYRQFPIGVVLTLANNELGPERLVGGEAGVNLAPARNLTWRTTWFLNRFTNAVSNVTIIPATTPGGAETRQRQNLGRTRIVGVQTDMEYRLASYWRIAGGYAYDVARVREFSANPGLIGKWLPQVPQHRGSFQLAYSNPKYATVSTQALFVGGQYDNDLNTLWLPYFGTVDVMANRTVSENMEVFFGVQNLLDREFLVQRNPTSIGAPRLFTGGFRLTFTGQ